MRLAALLFACLLTPVMHLRADLLVPVEEISPRYVAQIQLHTAAELFLLLKRSESLFNDGNYLREGATPIQFVLHGPEARAFLLSNYDANRELVDLAAKLSAFQVVEVRVCKVWMGGESIDESELPPFVGTVSYGPDEKMRLRSQGYVDF